MSKFRAGQDEDVCFDDILDKLEAMDLHVPDPEFVPKFEVFVKYMQIALKRVEADKPGAKPKKK